MGITIETMGERGGERYRQRDDRERERGGEDRFTTYI